MPRGATLTLTDSATVGLFFIQRYRFLTIDQFARATEANRSTAGDQLRFFERHGMLGYFGNTGLAGHGKPPRRSYHDRQWASKMREIGLQPTSTGEPGGMETGQTVSHYILPGGRYAKAYAKLAASGFQLH